MVFWVGGVCAEVECWSSSVVVEAVCVSCCVDGEGLKQCWLVVSYAACHEAAAGKA